MASIALPRSQARTPSGVMAWLTTVDHKKIGIMYLYATFFFFLVGGIFALLMRTQLAVGNNNFLAAQTYNEIMTLHGTTMIFLWIIPVFSGFGNYFVPLMIGARDMAFPRINAFSFWLIPLGGLTMYAGLLTKTGAAAAGWTGYVPLTEKAYAVGLGQDLWILGLHILGISSIMVKTLCITPMRFIISDGEVRISRTIPGSGEEALAVLKPGACFGEMAIFDRSERSTDAIANTGCTLITISRSDFELVLDFNRDIAYKVLWSVVRLLSARLRVTNDNLRSLLAMSMF